MCLAENKFGTGYVHQDLKPTDRMFAAGASEPVNWFQPFHIQEELKRKIGSSFVIPVNNQLQTKSCVGQAWSKYAGVRKVMLDPNPNWVEFSSKDVYSHIFLEDGGAYILDGGLFCRKGVTPEDMLPSIPMDEIDMRDPGLEDDGFPNAYRVARELVKGGSVEYVNTDVESVAKAIRDNAGCVIGIYGANNGTWLTEFPKTGAIQWGHALYAGAYRNLNGKKQIGVLNSWGTNCGNKGWQWLGEEWFDGHYCSSAFTWNPRVGEINCIADYERIYEYIQNHDLMDTNFYISKNWKEITDVLKLNITSGDFYDYCQLKKLI